MGKRVRRQKAVGRRGRALAILNTNTSAYCLLPSDCSHPLLAFPHRYETMGFVERPIILKRSIAMARESWVLTDVCQDVYTDDLEITASDLGGAAGGYRVAKRTLQGGLRSGVDVVEVDNGGVFVYDSADARDGPVEGVDRRDEARLELAGPRAGASRVRSAFRPGRSRLAERLRRVDRAVRVAEQRVAGIQRGWDASLAPARPDRQHTGGKGDRHGRRGLGRNPRHRARQPNRGYFTPSFG